MLLPAITATFEDCSARAIDCSAAVHDSRTPPMSEVEIINVRVSASIDVEGSALPAAAAAEAGAAVKGERPVYFPELRGYGPTTVYDRYQLTAGHASAGPAVIEERESTLVVGPGGRFEVLPGGSILVTIG